MRRTINGQLKDARIKHNTPKEGLCTIEIALERDGEILYYKYVTRSEFAPPIRDGMQIRATIEIIQGGTQL